MTENDEENLPFGAFPEDYPQVLRNELSVTLPNSSRKRRGQLIQDSWDLSFPEEEEEQEAPKYTGTFPYYRLEDSVNYSLMQSRIEHQKWEESQRLLQAALTDGILSNSEKEEYATKLSQVKKEMMDFFLHQLSYNSLAFAPAMQTVVANLREITGIDDFTLQLGTVNRFHRYILELKFIEFLAGQVNLSTEIQTKIVDSYIESKIRMVNNGQSQKPIQSVDK